MLQASRAAAASPTADRFQNYLRQPIVLLLGIQPSTRARPTQHRISSCSAAAAAASAANRCWTPVAKQLSGHQLPSRVVEISM